MRGDHETVTGRLVEVVEPREGSSVVGDQPVGTTVLPVANLMDFPDSGICVVTGLTEADDQSYGFTVDTDTNPGALLLDTGLTTAAVDGAEVWNCTALGLPESKMVAVVDLYDDESDPVRAAVPTGVRQNFTAGASDAGSIVALRSVGEGYEVASRPVQVAPLDLSTAAPGSLDLAGQGATPIEVHDAAVADIETDILTINDAIEWHVRTFYGDPALIVGENVGDILFDTTDGYRMYRWDGATWVDIQDAAILAAQEAADTALTSANGKNRVWHKTYAPTTEDNVEGDTWFQYDLGNNLVARFNGLGDGAGGTGTGWEQVAIGHEVIASLDLGKATVGFLDVAERVQARTITVDKLLVGFGRNWLANPGAETGDVTPHEAASGATVAAVTAPVRTGGHGFRVALPAAAGAANYLNAGGGDGLTTHMPVSLGDTVRGEFWGRYGPVTGSGMTARAVLTQLDATGAYVSSSVGAWTQTTGAYQKLEHELTVTDPAVAYVRMSVSAGSTVAGDVLHVDDMFLAVEITGELIVNGSIVGDHFNGQTFNGVKITGALVETNADPTLGLKLTDAGFLAYDSDPASPTYRQARVVIDPTTGLISAHGTLQAGDDGGSAVVIRPTVGADGGIIDFFSGAAGETQPSQVYGIIQTDENADNPALYLRTGTTDVASATASIKMWTRKGELIPGGGMDINAGRFTLTGSNLDFVASNYFTILTESEFSVERFGGIRDLRVLNGNTTIYNALSLPGIGGSSGAANMRIDATTGAVGIATSTRRNKTNIAALDVPVDTILALEPKTFTSLCEADDPARVFTGFIAEEAEELGLGLWVEHDSDALPVGFAYPSFIAAQQVALRSHHGRLADHDATLADVLARLSTLEGGTSARRR